MGISMLRRRQASFLLTPDPELYSCAYQENLEWVIYLLSCSVSYDGVMTDSSLTKKPGASWYGMWRGSLKHLRMAWMGDSIKYARRRKL